MNASLQKKTRSTAAAPYKAPGRLGRGGDGPAQHGIEERHERGDEQEQGSRLERRDYPGIQHQLVDDDRTAEQVHRQQGGSHAVVQVRARLGPERVEDGVIQPEEEIDADEDKLQAVAAHRLQPRVRVYQVRPARYQAGVPVERIAEDHDGQQVIAPLQVSGIQFDEGPAHGPLYAHRAVAGGIGLVADECPVQVYLPVLTYPVQVEPDARPGGEQLLAGRERDHDAIAPRRLAARGEQATLGLARQIQVAHRDGAIPRPHQERPSRPRRRAKASGTPIPARSRAGRTRPRRSGQPPGPPPEPPPV